MTMSATSYSGAAFHADFDGGRKSGSIQIDSRSVRFEGEGSSVAFPLSRLELRAGGASERLVFFSHPEFPEWSLYTSDRQVLEDVHLLANAQTAGSIARIRSEKRRSVAVVSAVLIALLCVLIGLVLLKDPLVRLVVRRIPVSIEQKLGDVALRQMMLMQTPVKDERLSKPLESIVERLTKAGRVTQPFRVHVVRDSSVNAFALPGGHLVINTGLLERVESGEEIAGVLGHEIAHVTERHSLEQIVSTVGVFTLVQLLFGDVSGLIAVAADGGAQLLTMSFSRDAEREADARGVEYLHRAQINPEGMLSFFGKLQKEEARLGGDKAAEMLEVISTHPPTGKRIEALTVAIAEWRARGRYRPLDVDIKSINSVAAAGKE